MIESALKSKLHTFPKLTDNKPQKLFDLLDILYEIESNKSDTRYSLLLSYFDSSSGILPIVAKLAYQLQEKWASRASQYKRNYNVAFPPFSFFITFIQEMCDLKNDPGLRVNHKTQVEKKNTRVLTRDSHVEEENSSQRTQNN
jgi:hypothetical protein